MTIGERMGVSTRGFDWLRLALAFGVVLWHASVLPTQGHPAALAALADAVWPAALASLCVPGFFAVSGFLVAASAMRTDVRVFYAFRLIRVLPALWCVVLVSALIAGPLLTALPLSAYVSSPRLWLYGLNLVGVACAALPGVFGGYGFNGSLWTIGIELSCYFWLGVAALAGVLSRRWLVLALAVAVYTLLPLTDLMNGHFDRSMRPNIMVACFVVGAAVYAWRDRIPYSPRLAIFTGALTVALNYAGLTPLGALPLAYTVITLGLSDAPALKNDLSYGVYLSAYPLQQAFVIAAPNAPWWLGFLSVLPLTTLYAYLSWRLIEAPINARKGVLARRLVGASGQAGVAAVQVP